LLLPKEKRRLIPFASSPASSNDSEQLKYISSAAASSRPFIVFFDDLLFLNMRFNFFPNEEDAIFAKEGRKEGFVTRYYCDYQRRKEESIMR
jgi:hypothetical protein